MRAKGLELEAQMRLRGGVRGQVSYALQQVTNEDTQQALTNSPRHMLKTRVSVDGPTPRSSIAAEVLYISSRTTLAGNTLPPVPLVNFTMIQPIGHAFELFGTIRNLFNEQYADPVSGQNLQDTIPQNGLTVRVGVRLKIGLK